jgi:hypothetical protein
MPRVRQSKNEKPTVQSKRPAIDDENDREAPVRIEVRRDVAPKSARAMEVRRIFQKLYRAPTRDSVLIFYQWLENNRPDLLSRGDDSYPQILSDVEDLLVAPATAQDKKKRAR